MQHKRLSGIYAISDEKLTPLDTIIAQADEAFSHGVKILQFRDKTSSDEAVRETCIKLQGLAKRHNATFIIDDRAELVQAIGADGLHIGKDDIDPQQARKIVGAGTIIGVSCYGSLHKARNAAREGADYVAFGSVFASPTKPHSNVIDHEVVARAKEQLRVPVCVIGGIDAGNIATIARQNPDMYSMVSGVFEGDIKDNLEKIKSIIGDKS